MGNRPSRSSREKGPSLSLSLDDSEEALRALHGREAVDNAALTSAHEIRPGLFLGGIPAALDPYEVHLRKITHVVNCLDEDCARFHAELPPPGEGVRKLHGESYAPPRCLTYLTLSLKDTPEEDILKFLSASTKWIEDALLDDSHRVLVHCMAGASRSVTVVIAYLMATEGLTAARALAEVSAIRKCANPNTGFRRQLLQWEASLQAERKAP